MKPTQLLTLLHLLYSLNITAQPLKRPSQQSVEAQQQFVEAVSNRLRGRYPEALEGFKAVLKNQRDNHAAMFEVAKIYRQLQKIDDATAQIQRAINLAPTNFYYLQLYAEILKERALLSKAADVYAQMIDLRPRQQDLYFECAYLLIASGRYPEALAIYQKAEAQFGIRDDLSTRKSNLYLLMGEANKARDELIRLTQAYPNTIDYQLQLAKLYTELRQPQQAEAVYRNILALDPDNAEVQLLLARHSTKNNPDNPKDYLTTLAEVINNPRSSLAAKVQALQPYRTGMRQRPPAERERLLLLAEALTTTHPTEAPAWTAAGDLHYNNGNYEQALAHYKHSLELDPNNLTLWEYSLIINEQLGQFSTLQQLATETTDLYPNQFVGYYYQGQALIGLRRGTEALEALQQALQLTHQSPPLQSDVYAAIAAAQMLLQQLGPASTAIDEALQLAPRNPKALCQAANLAALQGNKGRAEKMIGQAVQLKPDYFHCQWTAANISYQYADYSAALESAQKALELGGDRRPDVLELYANTLYRLQRADEAVVYWQRALQLGSNNPKLPRQISERRLYE